MRGLAALVVLLPALAHASDPPFAVVEVPPQPHATAAHVLYLNRCADGCTITRGSYDDAANHISTIPTTGPTIQLAPFVWPDATWNALVHCVREVYSPYALDVTDVQPPDGVAYNEAVVAGTNRQLGYDGAAGVSPMTSDCSPYANVMSFVFPNVAIDGDVLWLCWAVAHETGHAFGLDHTWSFLDGRSACTDPMSYRTDCRVQRFFRSERELCGESMARPCACGETQSAHGRLLSLLGAATPITAPPTIEVIEPLAGDQIAGAPVTVHATAQRGVAALEVWINGARWQTVPGQLDSAYTFALDPRIPDGVIDLAIVAKDDLGSATSSPRRRVVKGAPCTSADTCADGQHCDVEGRCLWDPPVGELGDACSYDHFCKSELCAGGGADRLCSQRCDVDDPRSCPDGFHCASDGSDGVCWPGDPVEPAGGCCDTGGAPPVLLAIVVGVLLFRGRRLTGRSYRDGRRGT
ncbi:MAG TPA: Ig-like domain-containing protein [Kofleriaceae bacterium]|nr:Ig-like domain-containing protein [Kofleriaceae bacterium]